METIRSIQAFNQILAENDAVLTYFSTENCSVCKVLKPKIIEMIGESFPKMKMIFIESDHLPELAAQNKVFAAPTILVFFAGRETIRKSRTFGLDELRSEIQRPYSILFG
ncbi:MAG TPA: thioredoxin [Prolixibacteraceae bacterium]|nr:thioredoxin [Prolixibacteraceae bacterium]